jgi:molecular chaperone GrpE
VIKKSASAKSGGEANLIAGLTADLQRTRADFENFRKQADIQRQQYGEVVKTATMLKILPLLDDMERAISAHPELAPISKSLEKTLGELAVSKIVSEPGTIFNPDIHDAVSMEDGDGEKEVVAEVLRPGYMYEGAIIRPSLVKVKKTN